MVVENWDINLKEETSPEGLCHIIEQECQPEILISCKIVESYFKNNSNKELPDATSELVQLLCAKLQDELKHLFLRESGIIFSGIKKKGIEFTIENKACENIHRTQQVIVNLLLKLRQILNNYVIQKEWSTEWKNCVHQIFMLEKQIHQWIYIEQSLLYPAITRKQDSIWLR